MSRIRGQTRLVDTAHSELPRTRLTPFQRLDAAQMTHYDRPPQAQSCHHTVQSLRRPVTHFPKSHPQGKISPPWIGCGTDQSDCPTESYSDGNHNSQALSGDVNGGAATVGTMSLPLTPLVTDIQWPRSMAPLAENSLKIGPAPKNVTDKALGASRCIWAASGRPPGVSTVRASRRGQWSDVILAHTHQYSTVHSLRRLLTHQAYELIRSQCAI